MPCGGERLLGLRYPTNPPVDKQLRPSPSYISLHVHRTPHALIDERARLSVCRSVCSVTALEPLSLSLSGSEQRLPCRPGVRLICCLSTCESGHGRLE